MINSTRQQSLRLEISETGIATIWLDASGRSVVVLDRDQIQKLHVTLEHLESRSDVKGLMLRSDCSRVFVAGADLAEIEGLDDHGLHAYLAFGTTVFGKIAALPYPTVALIQGAALGGGLELAMHCDGLIISKCNEVGKPYPIGLPETGLGICPGWGGTQLLPARMDPQTAMHMVATGNTVLSDTLPANLADVEVENPAMLEDAAIKWLESNESSSPTPTAISSNSDTDYATALAGATAMTQASEAAEAVFCAVHTGLEHGWSAAVAVEQCELIKLRNTPVAREKLDAFLSKG